MNARRRSWRSYWRKHAPPWVWRVLDVHSGDDPCDADGCGWHDDAANLHARTRESLARTVRRHPDRVQAAMRWARDAGAVHVHASGSRGHQQTYHYLTPGMPLDCPTCIREVRVTDQREDLAERRYRREGPPSW